MMLLELVCARVHVALGQGVVTLSNALHTGSATVDFEIVFILIAHASIRRERRIRRLEGNALRPAHGRILLIGYVEKLFHLLVFACIIESGRFPSDYFWRLVRA